MKRFILIFLWIPLYSFASTSPELDIQIDSLQQVIENAAHDTITFKAQLEWAKLVHPSDWESGIEITDKIEKACNTLLDEASNDDDKMLYLKYLDKATYLKGEIYNQNGEFEKSIELFKRSLGFAEELGNGKKQIKYLNNLGRSYSIKGDHETAWGYYKQTLARAKKFDNQEEIINALISISEASSRSYQKDTSLVYLEKGLKLSEEIGYEYGKARCFHKMGNNYYVEGDLVKASEYYYKSLNIYENLGLKEKIVINLFPLAYIYMSQEEYEQALEFINRSVEISTEIDDKMGLLKSWNFLGRIHYLKDEEPKALTYYQKSLKIAEDIGYSQMIGVNLELIGDIYLNQYEIEGKLDTALSYYQRALGVFEQVDNRHMIASTILEIGKVYDYKGDTQNGIETITRAYNFAKSENNLEPQQQTSFRLYELYKKTGDNKRALEMYETSVTLMDSIQNEESRQENIRQAIQYDYDKKSMADSLQNVQEQQIMEGEMVAQKQRFNLLLGGFGIAALLMSLLFYFYKKLGKANEISKKQAIMISQSNSELSKSLEHQMMLQGEIHHRVKNNLQVIISLLELQKEDITDVQAQESLEAMSGRIFSMSAIHEILYQKEGVAQIQFSDYAENLCRHFGDFSTGDDRPLFDLRIKNFEFNLETSMPLGIILTELLTNSLKYGRKPDQRLHISISLEKLDQWFSLVYRDNGAGFPTGKLKEREGGLGSYLLRSMTRQLKGQIKTENDNGAVYTIYFMGKESSKITTPTRSTITTKA